MRKRGYKTELDLNDEQITACLKHAGCARFAYNWGLARKQEARAAGLPIPNARQLHRELNGLKVTKFPYMYDVSKCAPQEALIDLDNAFKHFFRKVDLKKQRSEEHTSELQSQSNLVCRLLLEKKKNKYVHHIHL